ncbi:MAG: hypothetical protein Q4E89_13340, partial [Eubacteriales bacterium]|nr:hypothetical protein [Eubacteriales bacterium]
MKKYKKLLDNLNTLRYYKRAVTEKRHAHSQVDKNLVKNLKKFLTDNKTCDNISSVAAIKTAQQRKASQKKFFKKIKKF